MKHTPFHGWGVVDPRTQAAIDAGHPEWASLPADNVAGRLSGAKEIFTGKPCKHGHVATRYVSINLCTQCNRERMRKRWTTPEAKERARKYEREYYKRPEVVARWADDQKRWSDAWWKANKGLARHYGAKRRAQELSASPSWLTAAHRAEIQAVYAQAVERALDTGMPHSVDHIIPLANPDVCGLHVPWNLQVLTKSDNSRKSNKFDGTMDNEGWRV